MQCVILVCLLGLLASACGGSSSPVAVPHAAPRASFPRTGCRPHPLGGVHTPDRLKLLDACRAIVGTVKEARQNPEDGDAVFNLAPDRAYASMLNENNVKEGGIHVEIVPADQPGCRKGERVVHGTIPDLGKCTGAHVRLPKNGAHVRVVGAYVLDIDNAWREIHPVWRINVVGSAR